MGDFKTACQAILVIVVADQFTPTLVLIEGNYSYTINYRGGHLDKRS